jgi:hypothetical protein
MPRATKESALGPLRWLIQFVLPLLAGAGLIAAVVWLGRLTRDDLRRGEADLTFADVECVPPPGMSREDFLEEAQYLAGLPDQLDPLDGATADRVREALAAHPWVEAVRRVYVSRGRVSADLDCRVAVLWVAAVERAADRHGVLLPVSAQREGLVVLTGRARPPAGRPGQPWGDADVEAAARVVGLLWQRGKAIGLARFSAEVSQGEVTLRREGQSIVWGRAPGQERPGEPDADAKLARLLAAQAGGDADLRK